MPQTRLLIPVDGIVLDHENPRIKHFTAMYNAPELNEAQMLLALESSATDEETRTSPRGSYVRLKQSIRASQGVIQPIIVKPLEQDRYLCVEGNTRVAIYRELLREDQDAGLSGEQWTTIPAIVDAEMDAMEAHKVRLQVHLVGNRPWNPYSKAQYLYELREHHKMSMAELVAFCGGDERDVKESIAAYLDMEAHYRPLAGPEDFDVTRYSAFKELQTTRVRRSLHEHGHDEGTFAQWVHDRKIDPLSTVRQLPKILGHTEAKRVFLRNGAREAIKQLHVRDLDVRLREASIRQLAVVLVEKLDQMDYKDVRAIKTVTRDETADLLTYLQETLADLLRPEAAEDGPANSS